MKMLPYGKAKEWIPYIHHLDLYLHLHLSKSPTFFLSIPCTLLQFIHLYTFYTNSFTQFLLPFKCPFHPSSYHIDAISVPPPAPSPSIVYSAIFITSVPPSAFDPLYTISVLPPAPARYPVVSSASSPSDPFSVISIPPRNSFPISCCFFLSIRKPNIVFTPRQKAEEVLL